MAWFWDAYLPDHNKRAEITASPLQGSLGDLAGLPETFLIVDENDVLRDEGEAYARKLTEAGVRTTCVRFNGIIHDFMMLNPLRETAATTAAVEQAIHVLRKALRSRGSRGGFHTSEEQKPVSLLGDPGHVEGAS
jgi:acetyl esterase/lipase